MKVLFVRMPYRCFWEIGVGYPVAIGLLSAYLKEEIQNIKIDFLDFELSNIFKEHSSDSTIFSFFEKHFISGYRHDLLSQRSWESVNTDGSSLWEDLCDQIIEKNPNV